MLARHDPRDAYRRIDFDAAVASASARQLVSLCYEQLVAALGSALAAHERGDNRLKSEALTRALSALTALNLGISSTIGVAQALSHFYEAARRTLLENVVKFEPAAVARVRNDFLDVASALATAGP